MIQFVCHVVVVSSERFFNIPVHIAPPMYGITKEDMSMATAKGEKYDFDYFLIISKTIEVREPQEQKKTQKGKVQHTHWKH